MNWLLFASLLFRPLHQGFAKIRTDSTDGSANDVAETAIIQPLLRVKPPTPYDFTKHED